LPDCKTLGQWVDGFLLVIAAHRTPRKLIEEAMATLEPAKFAGVVFNQEDWTTHKYYYYNAYEAPREKGGRLRQLWRRLSPL
jgi:Mrp family chromosome partitioning ATPase